MYIIGKTSIAAGYVCPNKSTNLIAIRLEDNNRVMNKADIKTNRFILGGPVFLSDVMFIRNFGILNVGGIIYKFL